jgi:hypothetical protein
MQRISRPLKALHVPTVCPSCDVVSNGRLSFKSAAFGAIRYFTYHRMHSDHFGSQYRNGTLYQPRFDLWFLKEDSES